MSERSLGLSSPWTHNTGFVVLPSLHCCELFTQPLLSHFCIFSHWYHTACHWYRATVRRRVFVNNSMLTIMDLNHKVSTVLWWNAIWFCVVMLHWCELLYTHTHTHKQMLGVSVSWTLCSLFSCTGTLLTLLFLTQCCNVYWTQFSKGEASNLIYFIFCLIYFLFVHFFHHTTYTVQYLPWASDICKQTNKQTYKKTLKSNTFKHITHCLSWEG